MAAYRRFMTHVTCRLTAKKPGSAPEPYARYSSIGYLYLLMYLCRCICIFELATPCSHLAFRDSRQPIDRDILTVYRAAVCRRFHCTRPPVLYTRDRGIMRLCARIISRIIGDLPHNWANPAYSNELRIICLIYE